MSMEPREYESIGSACPTSTTFAEGATGHGALTDAFSRTPEAWAGHPAIKPRAPTLDDATTRLIAAGSRVSAPIGGAMRARAVPDGVVLAGEEGFERSIS